MSSETRQYNTSFDTKTKMLKIRFFARNISVVGDRVLTTEPASLPFTQAVSLSLELKSGMNESSSLLYITTCFQNNSQDDKTICFKTRILDGIDGESKKYEDEYYSSCLARANSSFRHHEYYASKDSNVINDSFTFIMYFEEAILCASQHIDDNEKTPDFLTTLYIQDDFKDIKFIVGDEILMAHKNIIATRSKVFRAMLTHDTKEKAEGVIEIKDVSFDAFEPFIKYLYTNQVDEEKVGDEMLQLADKYDVQCLRSKCEKMISQCIDGTNAVRYLIEADTCNFQLLKSRALEVICSQLKAIRETEEFKLLSPHPHLLEAVYNQYFNEDEVIDCSFTSLQPCKVKEKSTPSIMDILLSR